MNLKIIYSGWEMNTCQEDGVWLKYLVLGGSRCALISEQRDS